MTEQEKKDLADWLKPENIEQARRNVHSLVDKITSPGILHRVWMILTRAYNVQ